MPPAKDAMAEFKIGTFLCPVTKVLVPLMGACPLSQVEWPLVVQKCSVCGEKHTVRCEDVLHPPAFGYE